MVVSAGGGRISASFAYLGDRQDWQKCLEENCAELKG
jgi:hypothetical protein